MSAQANKETAEGAYRAFADGDAAAAMENMDDGVVWTARGDSALSGTYKGKEEIAVLWAKLGKKGLRTEPHDLDGESEEVADVLTYDDGGKLVGFEQLGDPAIANHAFPR